MLGCMYRLSTRREQGRRALQCRRKKKNWNAYNKTITEEVGAENHVTGDGEGKRTLQPGAKIWMVGHRGEHDRCAPICGGSQ